MAYDDLRDWIKTLDKAGELKRIQEELERERAGLEETRRRQIEFQTGRDEMLRHLTRGVELLKESEFAARRDSEQMAKSQLGTMLTTAAGTIPSMS